MSVNVRKMHKVFVLRHRGRNLTMGRSRRHGNILLNSALCQKRAPSTIRAVRSGLDWGGWSLEHVEQPRTMAVAVKDGNIRLMTRRRTVTSVL